jgi:selenium metabolism protein YedF
VVTVMEKIIDCKGLQCPHPVISTKKYFDSISEGEATVIVDNVVARNNVSKFAESNGFSYEISKENELYHIKIKKGLINMKDASSKLKHFTILISSNTLGSGDDKLGTALMKSYLFALSESTSLPTDMLFINGGVKLTVEDSECLESINKLQDKGVNIASCGTCLDFYSLKEKLAIGEITNMYTIVDKMNTADMTIKL